MITIGVIGAGKRTRALFRNIASDAPEKIEPRFVYDPSQENREIFRQTFAETPLEFAETAEEVVARPDVQAIMIGSPNSTHAPLAIAALRRRLPLFVEKPVAISMDECRELWRAYVDAGRPAVSVGFALRYSPFFRKLFEIVDSGVIGQLLTVDSDEHISAGTTALFWDGWRRSAAISGGLMIEKCSHDFDYLRRLTGRRAVRVYSAARRSHLRPDGPVKHARFDNYARRRAQEAGIPAPAQSIYDTPTDNADHQSVLIEWEDGILSSFTVAFGQPRNTRRVRILGSAGTIDGDAESGEITVEQLTDPDGEAQVARHVVTTDGTSHHGGDGAIRRTFWAMLANGTDTADAGLKDGIEAVVLGLAAEESARTKMPVEIGPIRKDIFGDEA